MTILAVVAVCVAPASAAGKKSAPKAKAPAPTSAPAEEKLVYQDIYVHHKAPFDSAKIRKLYLDGDFDEAIEILETALREKREMSHGDSVFFTKHLGVMYAAKYDTREKGKYYMHMLLMVEPTAKILDMYASDMIYMIFKNIQDEFDATRMKLDRAEDHVRGNSQRDSMPAGKNTASVSENKDSGSHPWIWVGAGTAVVAAGVTAYFILNDEPAPTTKDVDHTFPAN